MDTGNQTTQGNGSLLSAQDIRVVKGGKTLVDTVSIHVPEGALVGLIGPNGAGKSTLLSVMAGLSKPDGGHVYLGDTPIHRIPDRQRAQTLGWLEQLSTAHWPVTVEYIVMLGRIPYLSTWQKPGDDDAYAVDHALASTDCTHLRHQSVTTLSGGELTRVMLARILAADPQVILADEPIAALDIGHQLQTMDVLRDYATGSKAAVVVLHDLSLAARYCDYLYLIHEGHLVAEGRAGQVLIERNLRDVYGVDVLSGEGDVPWIVPLRRVDATQDSGETPSV